MSLENNEYLELVLYNIWSNRRVLDASKKLDKSQFTRNLGGSFPSVWSLLVHLLSSDFIWLQRWKGVPLVEVPIIWKLDNVKSICTAWNEIDKEKLSFFKNNAPIDPTQEIRIRTAKNEEFSMPFGRTVLHMVNHATYHRGQIAYMFRQLNQKPVSTDLYLYYKEKDGLQ